MKHKTFEILGLVTDEDGQPIEAANIVISGIHHNVSTTSRGEYWRLLLPGTYTVYATAWGYVQLLNLKISCVISFESKF